MILENARTLFEIKFDVIDGGLGSFYGALEDIELSEGATVTWVAPRRILKTDPNILIKAGMVIQSPRGMKYMLSNHSLSETSMGVPFNSFKLYEANTVASLVKRTSLVNVRTGLEEEGPMSDPINIYISYEPMQEAFDRELRIPNEKTRIVTNYPLEKGHLVNEETVIEVRYALGLYSAILG